jgi:hypothetical protein
MTPIPILDGEMITAPGLYSMSEAWYHADPCKVPSLSCSLAKYALPMGAGTGTARHLWHNHPRLNPAILEVQDDSHRFDLGSVFHTLILGKGDQIEVIDAKDWRTNAAKAARDAALEAGLQPVLAEQMERARAMLEAARPQIAMREDLARAMASGMAEVVLVWIEQTDAGEIWCRCKLDWLPTEGRIFPDWKTTGTGAGPDEYGRTYFSIGADLQDAFYRRGIRAVLDRSAELVFPVIETAAPHCMMVHRTAPASLGMAERKVLYVMRLFALCMREGVWPGYPIEDAWQDAPSWIESKWIDREDAGLTSIDFNRYMIEQSRDLARQPQLDQLMAADFDLEGKQ